MNKSVRYLCFYSVLAAASLISACSVTNQVSVTKGFSESRIYSNKKGFELSVNGGCLLIKHKDPQSVRTEYGIFNPTAGAMAVLDDVPYERKEIQVNVYRIVNEGIFDLFEAIIAMPSTYSGRDLDSYFDGNLPYVTWSGKFGGRDIVAEVRSDQDVLQRLQSSGLRTLSAQKGRNGYGFNYRGTVDSFITGFTKVGELGYGKPLRVDFQPKLVNESGFKLRDVLEFVEFSSERTAATGKYRVDIKKKKAQEDYYTFQVEPKNFEFDYDPKGVVVIPTVTVTQKKVGSYAPNLLFSNRDIEVRISELSAQKGSYYRKSVISFTFDIKNKTTKSLNIDAISFYLNDTILTWTQEIKLPPVASVTRQRLSTLDMQGQGMVDAQAAAFNRFVSVAEAKNTACNLGASIDYRVQGVEQNLYQATNVRLHEMLADRGDVAP